MEGYQDCVIDINHVIAVINGWVINKKAKQVISVKQAKILLGNKKLIEKLDYILLKRLNHYDISSTVLIYDNSETLFDHIEMAFEYFAELENGSILAVTHRKAPKRTIMRTYPVLCHKFKSNHGTNYYLAPTPLSKISKVNMKSIKFNPRKLRDTSVFSNIIQVDSFEFTNSDGEILKSLPKFKIEYGKFIQDFYSDIYKNALKRAGNHLGKDFHTGVGSLVKTFIPPTILEYGRRLVLPLFLLMNGKKLSFFKDDQFLPDIKLSNLVNAFKNKDKTELESLLCPIFLNALERNKYYEYLMRWVRLCSFDVTKIKTRENIECPLSSILDYRYKLDAIRCLVLFSSFNSTEDPTTTAESYTTPEENNFISTFKTLYTLVVNESKTLARNNISVDIAGEYVLVKGKMLSFHMISLIKAEVNASFQSCVDDLFKLVSFGTPVRVYRKVFFNSQINTEGESTSKENFSSIFDTIPQENVREYNIDWRNEEDSSNENTIKNILILVNQITKLLMFSVWLSPGMALRFPELSILSFSGYDRNLFVDVIEKIFYFKTTYNKNKKFDSRLLFMDKTVTTNLLWFVYILRPFTIDLMQDKLSLFKTDMLKQKFNQEYSKTVGESFEDVPEEEEEEARRDNTYYSGNDTIEQVGADAGDTIMKMFLFVDVKNYRLVSSGSFTSTMKYFPKDQSVYRSHTIRSFRQGLIALWKHFIMPSGLLFDLCNKIVSNGYGHTVQTHNNNYGVDNTRHIDYTSEGDLDYYHAKVLCQKFQAMSDLNIRKRDDLDENVPTENRDDDNGPAGGEADVFDLIEEGKKIYGEKFQFLSPEQEQFTSNVLLSPKRFHALQGETAFGKTLTFSLPILALHKTNPGKYIHFLAVPYQSLKVASINKLRKLNLQVEDIKILESPEAKNKIKSINVLVGCFDSFTSSKIKDAMACWNNLFEDVKKGYFIFDEAHCLWLEKKFRNELSFLRGFKWNKFLKIIMLSATLPKLLMEFIAIERDIPEKLVNNGRYINVVKNIPNQHISSEVFWVEKDGLMDNVRAAVRDYLKSNPTGKAVFFFSNKQKMRKVYTDYFKSDSKVSMVDADATDDVKMKVFEDFENLDSDTRVIFGTKLLSNGLNCETVNHVCLANCKTNAIDYLQMVGRIRQSGSVKIIAVKGEKPYDEISEASLHFPHLNWNICITKQIAQFYTIVYPGHILCCGTSPKDNYNSCDPVDMNAPFDDNNDNDDDDDSMFFDCNDEPAQNVTTTKHRRDSVCGEPPKKKKKSHKNKKNKKHKKSKNKDKDLKQKKIIRRVIDNNSPIIKNVVVTKGFLSRAAQHTQRKRSVLANRAIGAKLFTSTPKPKPYDTAKFSHAVKTGHFDNINTQPTASTTNQSHLTKNMSPLAPSKNNCPASISNKNSTVSDIPLVTSLPFHSTSSATSTTTTTATASRTTPATIINIPLVISREIDRTTTTRRAAASSHHNRVTSATTTTAASHANPVAIINIPLVTSRNIDGGVTITTTPNKPIVSSSPPCPTASMINPMDASSPKSNSEGTALKPLFPIFKSSRGPKKTNRNTNANIPGNFTNTNLQTNITKTNLTPPVITGTASANTTPPIHNSQIHPALPSTTEPIAADMEMFCLSMGKHPSLTCPSTLKVGSHVDNLQIPPQRSNIATTLANNDNQLQPNLTCSDDNNDDEFFNLDAFSGLFDGDIMSSPAKKNTNQPAKDVEEASLLTSLDQNDIFEEMTIQMEDAASSNPGTNSIDLEKIIGPDVIYKEVNKVVSGNISSVSNIDNASDQIYENPLMSFEANSLSPIDQVLGATNIPLPELLRTSATGTVSNTNLETPSEFVRDNSAHLSNYEDDDFIPPAASSDLDNAILSGQKVIEELNAPAVMSDNPTISDASQFFSFLNEFKDVDVAKNLKEYLMLDGSLPMQKYFLGFDTRNVLRWFIEIPSSLCRECLELNENCSCSTIFGQALGRISAEVLILSYVQSSHSRFNLYLNDLEVLGSKEFIDRHSDKSDSFKHHYKLFESRAKMKIISISNLEGNKGKKFTNVFIDTFKMIKKYMVDIRSLIFDDHIKEAFFAYKTKRHYITKCFQDYDSIQSSNWTNSNTGILVPFKRDCLLDFQHYYKTRCLVSDQKVFIKYIPSMKSFQIVIFFIWCFFEKGLHKEVLKKKIKVMGFDKEKVDLFPIFFNTMLNVVDFDFAPCPAFVPIIGAWMKNNPNLMDWYSAKNDKK